AGEPLPWRQGEIAQRGAAIECRVYAEDPAKNFLPSPGTITRLVLPEGEGIRVEAGVAEGTVVPVHYDPLLLKLIAHGRDRGESMKMEIPVEAPRAGAVKEIRVQEGQTVQEGDVVAVLE